MTVTATVRPPGTTKAAVTANVTATITRDHRRRPPYSTVIRHRHRHRHIARPCLAAPWVVQVGHGHATGR